MVKARMRIFQILAFVLIWASDSYTAEVKAISWETKHAAPVVVLDGENEKLLPLVRFGVTALPEQTVMRLTFVGGYALGLPKDKAKSLQELFSRYYQRIGEDPIFSQMPSALEYCYAKEKNSKGFATIYVPDEVKKNSRVICFLHGSGGSFSLYLYYLAEMFPEHIIICPAYGSGCAHISSEYLAGCVQAASDELGHKLERPILVGLSAGGFGGFREYVRRPQRYLGYICIAAYPPRDVFAKLPVGGRIRVICGGDERFVRNGVLEKSERRVRGRVKDYESHIIPNQDHFFLLSAQEETRRLLKGWERDLREKEE